jgi:hypothetical protein
LGRENAVSGVEAGLGNPPFGIQRRHSRSTRTRRPSCGKVFRIKAGFRPFGEAQLNIV